MNNKILPLSFYRNKDVLEVARKLLGKYLITSFGGKLTGGMIQETEGYRGPEDRASHAFGNRRTKRNEVMYQEGGVCYVYFIYGLHYLFNVVTNDAEIPHGVLIRSIFPEIGIEEMMKRRHKGRFDKTLTAGPGSLCQALGIDRNHNGHLLSKPPIWIEDRGIKIDSKDIVAKKRVGIDFAGEDAKLLWRFTLTREALAKI